jgi:hypothetical protein
MTGGSEKVVAFPKAPAPIEDGPVQEWQTPLDCLRELVAHIESGRLPTPRLLYCAMQIVGDDDNDRYPFYCWAEKENPAAHLGMLSQHVHNFCGRASNGNIRYEER